MKIWYVAGLLLVTMITFTVFQIPDDSLHLFFCDVGQGDSIVLVYKNTQVLIDGGRDAKVLKCLREAMPFWDRKIELLVATHADADHIGGLPSVISAYDVDTVFIPAHGKKTNDFRDFYDAVLRKKGKKITLVEPMAGTEVSLSSKINLTILSNRGADGVLSAEWSQPYESTLLDTSSLSKGIESETNDGSIVIFMSYKRITSLFTGDLETAGEQALLNDGLIRSATILKVGHHGSKSSSSKPFLDKVTPEIAVISAGQKNAYGHPHQEIIQKLREMHAQILRTDTLGTVHLVTNGLSVKQMPHWLSL